MFAIPITFSVVPEQQQEPRLLPFLKPFASGRNQFLRANASPFLGAKTRDHIASLNRKTLLLAGFASEVVVLHAAVQAAEAGYRVIVVVNACGGSSESTDRAALQQMRDASAVLSPVISIATVLGPDFTTRKGQEAYQVVQTLRLT